MKKYSKMSSRKECPSNNVLQNFHALPTYSPQCTPSRHSTIHKVCIYLFIYFKICSSEHVYYSTDPTQCNMYKGTHSLRAFLTYNRSPVG